MGSGKKASGKLVSWKALLARKFKALLCLRSSSIMDFEEVKAHREEGRPQYSDLIPGSDAASPCPMDCNSLGHGDTASSTSIPSLTDLSDSNGRYDVFLSFRGSDTRNNFTDHLYAHLVRKGIFAFKDDTRLHEGQPISPQLLQAIQDSRVCIVVFSKEYAASTWCLDEMAAIADRQEAFKRTVLPVFYDVDPSHVRNQNGVYEEAFLLHRRKFKQDPGKVIRWQEAMSGLANSVGWDVRDKPEFEEIEKIVRKVIKTLNHKFSGFADDLIGIQPRVQRLEDLLKLNSEDDDFRLLGIWGMGGIGKTTHATVLYDRISHRFDASCFVENVSKIYKDGGAIAVQKQILRQTLDEKNLDTFSPSEISGIVTKRLSCIKVLMVLDNVEESEQLEKLAISPNLLRTGSRIIITTRDAHILKVYGVRAIHKVPLLNYNDARELFTRKAFKSDDPSSSSSSSCLGLIPEVLKYADGLPLAIRVVGSFLCTRNATQWRATLEGLRNNPDKNIMKVLQISFEGLEPRERETFLHIACFFKGDRVEYVSRILDCCGLDPDIGIPLIIEQSLITIRNQEIHMHEMLQELGKKIVKEQFPKQPGLWSRLWLYQDFHHVMISETGTNNVQAMVLDPKEDVSKYSGLRAEELSKIRGLRLLILYHKKFSGSLNFLSNCLQYLLWHGYPFASLPLKFQPDTLVELNMPHSRIKRLWEEIKYLPCLKRVDLSNSKYLIEMPDFEGIPKLMRLDLTGCTNLSKVHPSIGLLKELAFLSLRNCSSLVSLDFGSESKLSSLGVLHLSGCTKLENTPNFTGLSNLEYLDLEQCTSLSTVHESVGALAKLKFLSLRHCTNLVTIPNSIITMRLLITLDLCGCLKLMSLGQTFMSSYTMKSLIFLDIGFCNLREVPRAIGDLRCLERLNLQGNDFVTVPYTTTELSSLAYLNLSHCYELRYLPELPSRNASSVGRYFETVSGARNHRSGLYVFDCPMLMPFVENPAMSWLMRLVQQPRHFRCGFDIVIPGPGSKIPEWFNYRFNGVSTIRIGQSNVDDNWIGFAFCVAFEVNNIPAISASSLPLRHPFYLSFESEVAEESFDMPLRLHMGTVVGSKYLWLIYMSRPHCHFVERRTHITFKARPGLNIMEWGLRMVLKQSSGATREDHFRYEYVRGSSSSSESKIQLPYNWLVTEEDENENMGAKEKENNLSNMGL